MKSGYSWALVGALPPTELMPPPLPGPQADFKRAFCHLRSLSAVDMRQLTQALAEAQEGTGEVRAVLLHAAFKPRLPGLTKMVSKLSKEGGWRKALEVYETVEEMGMVPDTALTNAAISACDKGGRWQKALEIFESMDRLRLPRDAITYSATISSLAKGKQWHAALQVFDHMRTSGVPADVVTCCSLINALEKGGQWQLAEALFVQMCSGASSGATTNPENNGSNKPPGEVSPSSVLDALLHFSTGEDDKPGPLGSAQTSLDSPGSGKVVEASSSLEENLASQLKTSLSLDAANGAALASSTAGNPFATAASITSSIRRSASEIGPRSPSLASLLGGTGVLDRSLSGQGRRMVSSVHDATASTHLRRAMSSFSSRVGSSPSGSPTEQSPPEIPEHTATLLASAAECFSHAARVTPNRVCCNALLAAYARARPPQWEKALHLLRAMWEGVVPSLTPDAVSFNTVLKACAGASRLPQVNEVFQEMLQRGIRPNVTTFNCLIGAATEAGDTDLLRQVGSWLDCAERDVRQACTPVYLTATAKVNGSGFANGGISHQYGSSSPWIQELSPLSRSLSSPSSRPGTASSPSHSSAGLVTLLLQAREYQRVRSLFFEVASAGQAPSGGLAQGMMTACAASGAWTEAVQALRTILRGGLEGGATIQASLVTGCLQALARSAQVVGPSGQPGIANAALQIYYETQAISYDAQTYVTLIQVFATTGNPHQVVAVHELMLREGYTPDTGGALIILQSMLQLGEVAKATFLAHSLVSQGIHLDAETLLGLITACGHIGVWEPAQSLCAVAHSMQLPCAASAYNLLLNAAVAAGKYGLVAQLLSAMQASSISVDSGVLASLMSLGAEMTATVDSREESTLTEGEGTDRDHLDPALSNVHGITDQQPDVQTDEASYRLLIRSAVQSGQPHLAVQLCSQAHSSGVVQRYFLPHEPSGPLVNLRGADLELATTVMLTWLSLLTQLPNARATPGADSLSVLSGHDAEGAKIQNSIRTMLTTGESPVIAFRGLVPVTLPPSSINSVPGLMTIPMKVITAALM